jgi:sugar/nucleoside kinase (ribokinase family)
MIYDIVTIGDCVNDIFIKPHGDELEKDRLKRGSICFPHGSKISVDETHQDIGGSACNVAVGLSRQGYQTAIIGAIGKDKESEKIKNRLFNEKVDFKFLKEFFKNKTNFSVIIVYKNDRTVLVYRGLKDYSEIKIPKVLKTKWIYLGPVANSFESNYKDIVRLVSEKNVNLAINPGHRQIAEGREALKRLIYVSKVLILNKEEAVDLTKMSTFLNIKELLKRLKSFGTQIAVITDGKNGAYCYDGEEFLGIKIHEVETVDTTGAGDAFSSGFLGSFIKDNDISNAMKWGIINSASVVTDFGAQTKLMTKEDLEKYSNNSLDVYKL